MVMMVGTVNAASPAGQHEQVPSMANDGCWFQNPFTGETSLFRARNRRQAAKRLDHPAGEAMHFGLRPKYPQKREAVPFLLDGPSHSPSLPRTQADNGSRITRAGNARPGMII